MGHNSRVDQRNARSEASSPEASGHLSWRRAAPGLAVVGAAVALATLGGALTANHPAGEDGDWAAITPQEHTMSQVLVERTDVTTRTTPLATAAAPALAGLGFVSLAVTQLIFPAQTDPFSAVTDYVIEYAYVVGLWATVFAVLGLHRFHRGRPGWGRLGLAATIVYGVGHALVGTAVATTAVRGMDSLGVLFLPGILGWLVGGVLLAVAAFRAHRLPRVLAVAIGLGLPLTMALGLAGPFVDGAIWLAIAAAIVRTGRRS